MSVSITNTSRERGVNCNHLIVTLNVEGVTRTFMTTLDDIDALPMTQEDLKDFIMRWAKYRRSQGRSIMNIAIA